MSEIDDPKSLVPATLSFCIALVPRSPLYEQVSEASLAISKQMPNQNIIDNHRFPTHLSLYIGGMDMASAPAFKRGFQNRIGSLANVRLYADALYTGSRGFLGLRCVKDLHLLAPADAVIEYCAEQHRLNPRYRPHTIERWPQLSLERKLLLTKNGTYNTTAVLDAHFSIAEVPEDRLADAVGIARGWLLLPCDSEIHSIQFVDIGHKNEHWRVLAEWVMTAT